MKMKKTIGLVLALCLVSALVMAEASDGKEAGQKADVSASKQRQKGAPRVSASRQGDPRNRQQAYKEMLEKRKANHKKTLAELEEIKKIAEEENATRTAEALGKMIDKKNAEFKQSMEQFEGRRRERSRQLQRTDGRPVRKKPAETTESKAAEEK